MTLPAWVAPQLATLVSGPPPGDDWCTRIKLDGYRILLRSSAVASSPHPQSPDWTARFAVAEERRCR
jgi:bifunctional non-homologous end joining protein LigD